MLTKYPRSLLFLAWRTPPFYYRRGIIRTQYFFLPIEHTQVKPQLFWPEAHSQVLRNTTWKSRGQWESPALISIVWDWTSYHIAKTCTLTTACRMPNTQLSCKLEEKKLYILGSNHDNLCIVLQRRRQRRPTSKEIASLSQLQWLLPLLQVAGLPLCIWTTKRLTSWGQCLFL